jgi:spore maturation protein SpmA
MSWKRLAFGFLTLLLLNTLICLVFFPRLRIADGYLAAGRPDVAQIFGNSLLGTVLMFAAGMAIAAVLRRWRRAPA